MRTKKTILQFFFYLIFFGFTNVFAQVNQDSLNYYIAKINSKTADANELAKAYLIFDKAKAQYLKKGSIAGGVYCLDRMSEIERRLGLFYDSESTAVEGLKLLDELPINPENNKLRNRIVNRIAMILWDYQKYEESLQYCFDLLKVVQSKSDSATVYNNIGITYKKQQKYDTALFYLKDASRLSQQIKNDHPIKAMSLDNLGFVQGMLGKEQGLVNMKKALEMRMSDSTDVYQSYRHLTEFYTLKNNKSEALFYANKTYDLALKNNNESDLIEAMRNLLDLGEHQIYDKFRALDDKVTLERLLSLNKFSQVKYNYEKAEEKVAQAKAKAARYRLIYGSTAGFIFISSISLFFIIRTRHKKKILVQQFETEQYISKKLHDEVANDVFHTITKVRGNKTRQPELLNALDGIYHKVRDISKSNADLNVTKDFGRLLNDLLISYKTEQVNIITIHLSNIEWTDVSEIKRKTLYRVLQELMVNMEKHSQATLVTLNFEKDKGKLSVRYVDNGVGCQLEKGSGLTNTESRMEMVNGKITFESEIGKGFRVHLIL
jgi:tetratricopeptide (TPR) repeat protein